LGDIPTRYLVNALRYMQKVFVGRGEEDEFLATVKVFEKEINKRRKNETTGH
jgi:hypothetical protein